MIDAPMFKSVRHALQIAYLMEFVQMYAKAPLARLIDGAMERYGIEPEEERSVFWGHLDQLEIKAQCAMIRNVCQRELSPKQYNFVLAKYSLEPDDRIPAQRHFHDEVKGDLKCSEKDDATLEMCLNVINHGVPSARKISREYDETLHKVNTDIGRIKAIALNLEREIEEILWPIFSTEGVA